MHVCMHVESLCVCTNCECLFTTVNVYSQQRCLFVQGYSSVCIQGVIVDIYLYVYIDYVHLYVYIQRQ